MNKEKYNLFAIRIASALLFSGIIILVIAAVITDNILSQSGVFVFTSEGVDDTVDFIRFGIVSFGLILIIISAAVYRSMKDI